MKSALERIVAERDRLLAIVREKEEQVKRIDDEINRQSRERTAPPLN